MMADEQLVNTLENSAQILLAPPNLVTEEQRHVAEQVFIALEKSAVSIETCRLILETSKNDFVLFQAASLFRQGIVRNWSSLGLDVVDAAHTYILNYIISHASLVPYVREQMVLSLAVIYKRRQVEQVAEKNSTLFSDIARLVQSGNTYMQLVACSILLALLNEFSSSSRTSSIGLTWELHSKCKIKFEQGDLKQVFVFCLQTLSDLLSHSSVDTQASVVIERLLAVLEQIFGWDFTARISKQMVSLTNGQSTCFRPPMSWRDVILMNDIVNVLFQLHLKVRNNAALSNQSLLSLAQLASLTGPIFADEVAHRDFVERFVKAFLSFMSSVELKSCEALGIANMLGSLMGFTPSWALQEVPTEVLSGLLSCMTQLTCGFCRSAHLANGNNQSSEDSAMYMEALEKSLDAWMAFVNHVSDFPPGILRPHAIEVFGTYLQCHLSSQDRSNHNDSSDDYEDEDEEDEEKFSDQLFCIGAFARLVPDYSIPLLHQLLQEKTHLLEEHLRRLQPVSSLASSSSSGQTNLDSINEDLHWLLLIATNVLMSRVDGDLPMIPESLIDFTLSDVVASESSIVSLISQEVLPAFQATGESHVVRLVATVFRFGQLEAKAFEAGLVNHLSPQVSESLMGFMSRWAATYLLFDESYYSKMSPAFSLSFGADSEGSQWIINLILNKIHFNLCELNSETKAITNTLDLLRTLVDQKNRCDVTVKCSAFWDMASNFSANVFPFSVLSPDAKKSFCQTLILASSANISAEQRQAYIQMVLGSFSSRFKELRDRPDLRTTFHSDSVKVEVQNSLDCLCAVAEAARASNAVNVFELLHPLLVDAVSILELYHNYEEVVQLVLELFNTVTKQLSCYLSKGDSVRMYKVCLLMMQTFSKHNQGRRVVNKDAEDDQFKDLVSLIQMLMNILSKDYINFSDSENDRVGVTSGPELDVADVALFGLNLLVPLMTTELLKIPALCSSYLGLLSYMAEVHAAHMSRLSDQVFANLTSTIEFSVGSHGIEIMRLSLELIASLATHVYEEKSALEGSAIFRFGYHFLKVLFELLLVETFDVELMESASNALFALICCHQQRYCEMVNELLSRHTASPYYQRLLNAFNKLTPPDFPMQISRQNRIRFMESFDQFLVDVRGFLCVR